MQVRTGIVQSPRGGMLRLLGPLFAAGLGGANAVTVLPYTAALGLPDRFARRTARNTQLILIEESNLARVADPAGGSGAVEALTNDLCVAAWAQFQEIEAAGGLGAALETGLIQAQVAKVRAERESAIATRQEPLTGTSEFPDIAERPVAVLAATANAHLVNISARAFVGTGANTLVARLGGLSDIKHK